MTNYLVSFGHGYSKSGSYDTGCVSDGFTEQDMVRRLRPYIKKWADVAGANVYFYDNNMYADRNVADYKGYVIVEVHLDAPAGTGGHVIISNGMSPDGIDTAFADLIKKWFGTISYVGADGINERSDLLNLNVCASNGTNYRLIELFFLSNKEDRDTYLNNLDAIGKDFVQALIGKSISGETSTASKEKIETNYKMEIGYEGFSIDSKPWGEKGAKNVSTTDEHIGKVVTITEENASREYAKTELGWIDKRALISPEPDRIVVDYQADVVESGYSFDTRPWGESGFRQLDVSDRYIGHNLRATKENISGEYAYLVRGDVEIGWIDKRAIKRSPVVAESRLFLPNGQNWVIYPENGSYDVGQLISIQNNKGDGFWYVIQGDKGNNVLVINLQGTGNVGIYFDKDKGAKIERKYA